MTCVPLTQIQRDNFLVYSAEVINMYWRDNPYYGNFIIAEPLKNRTTSSITQAFTKPHQLFEQTGIAPNTYIMDNETSDEFMRALKEKGAAYQLVSPHTP